MPAISASAPGKIILFGEHSVVYGRPAIAVPLLQVQARAAVFANPRSTAGQIRIEAPEISLEAELEELPEDNALRVALRLVMEAIGVRSIPACTLRIRSEIPPASGLGSGAAVTVAVVRAFSTFLGKPLDDEQVNAIAFEVEKLHHGNPSGIDNTVITYRKPVYFVKDLPIETLNVGKPFALIVADTGIPYPTADAVALVRSRWEQDQDHYNHLFDSIGKISASARAAIEKGSIEQIGPLMNANQAILGQIGVTSPALDILIRAARAAGAWGAKLSGAGLGGNILALAAPEDSATIEQALRKAGAVRTIVTRIEQNN